jgi:hypothetical protein
MADDKNLEKIGAIKATVPRLSPSVKLLSDEEKERYSLESRGIEQDQNERKKYAHRSFVLCCVWICAIYILLMFAGFGSYRHFHFVLSEHVLLAAIGSTTANLLGVFLIVIRYVFPKKTH